jgi:hypothetical protein
MGDRFGLPPVNDNDGTVLLLAARWLVSAPAAVPVWEAPSAPCSRWTAPLTDLAPSPSQAESEPTPVPKEETKQFQHHNRRIDAEIIVGRRLQRK